MKTSRKQGSATTPPSDVRIVVFAWDHPGRYTYMKWLSGTLPEEYDRLEVIEIVSSADPVVAKLSINHGVPLRGRGKCFLARFYEKTLDLGAVVVAEFVIPEVPDEES